MKFNVLGEYYELKTKLPFSKKFKNGELIPIDLSEGRTTEFQTQSLEGLTKYVRSHISNKRALGAFGGYAEKRNLYSRSNVFHKPEGVRDVHLGIDFWLPAGTEIVAPLPGVVHSFANNHNSGDYGPTIVLKHYIGNEVIHSLYGHLSKSSLENLAIGQIVTRGQRIGELGTEEENVHWPPHLHFQLIRNMENKLGDYPGVCHEQEVDYYFENCPNPLVFFGHQWIKKLYRGIPL